MSKRLSDSNIRQGRDREKRNYLGKINLEKKHIKKYKINEEIKRKTNLYIEEILDELPVALTTYDESWQLSFANKKACSLFGFELKDVKGLSVNIIEDIYYADDEEHMIKKLKGNIKKVTNQIRTIRNSKGEYLVVSLDAYKLKNKGFLCLFDEAKRIQALENLQLQTQTILNSLDNFVVMTDNNKKIIMFNHAFEELVEMKPDKIRNENICRLFNKLKPIIQKAVIPHEAVITTLSGKVKNILFQTSSIYNVEGEKIGMIEVGSDITALLKEQQKRRQNEKLIILGQMAAGIVHEIRNPLTAMLGFSQLIKLKTKELTIIEFASCIEKEVEAMNKIVSDFLTFAKPQPPVMKVVLLNDVLDSLKLMLETNTFMKKIKINYKLEENNPIMADQNLIKQVVLNIINNAIDALDGVQQPVISIRTGFNIERRESFITIHNNGKCMKEEEKEMVGTPFFSTKTNKGTGLGLSICFQIIRDHNGRIEFDSNAESGTFFTLYFPANPQEMECSQVTN